MNKLALSSLTIEQLQQCKSNLSKRIDDLKFFNLDLGRTNINLAEEYRELRERAQKVKQGKMAKTQRTRGLRKNIYLQKQPVQHTNTDHHSQNVDNKSVNRNNFNFNDLYKMSKSKLSGWLGTSKGSKKHQQIDLPHQSQPQQLYRYIKQQHPIIYYEQVMIVGDFPPAEVMSQESEDEKDPMEREITQIIVQAPVIKAMPLQKEDPLEQGITHIIKQAFHSSIIDDTTKIEQNPHQHSQNLQDNYQRLYNSQDNCKYILEQQSIQKQTGINHQQQHNNQVISIDKNVLNNYQVKVQQKNSKTKTTMKTFEFDDLPSIGWKKLKGFIGWGGKNNKSNQQKQKQTKSHMQVQARQDHLISQSPNIQPNTQRKRIPIFGPSYQQVEQQSMKQAKLQKQNLKQQTIQVQNQHIQNQNDQISSKTSETPNQTTEI